MGAYRDWMKPTSEYVADWRGAPTFPVPVEQVSGDVALYSVAEIEQLVAEHAAMRERIRRDERALGVLGLIALVFAVLRGYGAVTGKW